MVRIGEYCKVTKGKIGIKKAVEGDYPLVTTAEERLTHNEYHFDKPSVIIPVVSSTGHGHASLKRIHYQEGQFAVGSILAVVTPKDETILSALFLFHYLDLYKEQQLVSRMKGMANVTLPIKAIEDVQFPLMSLEQQLEWNDLFTRTKRHTTGLTSEITNQKKLLKKLRQQILQDAISGKLTAKWREENPDVEPASELLTRIKVEKERLVKEKKIKKQKSLPPISDDEIPFELPEGWCWCRFIDITTVITCGIASTPRYYESGRIFLSAKNVKPYKFMPENHKFIDDETYRKIVQNAKPELNDILLTRVGAGIGEATIIDQDIDFAFYVSLTLIKPLHQFVNARYLLHYLNSPDGIKNAITYKTGDKSSQGNLNVGRVREFLIPLPPEDEAIYIAEKIDGINSYCSQLEAQSTKSQQEADLLMSAVLKEAFEG